MSGPPRVEGIEAAPLLETVERAASMLDGIPHRPPFRFLSDARFDDTDPDAVEGAWALDGSEPFFAGHFPNDPIVPGMLVTEALAQLCGVLMSARSVGNAPAPAPGFAARAVPMLARAEIRFLAPVRPPATIELRAKLDRAIGTLVEFEVSAFHDARRIADGRLALRSGAPAEGAIRESAPREAP